MYEVTELLNSHKFKKKIFPVLLDSAKGIFDADNRVVYYDYWKKKWNNAKKNLKKHSNLDLLDEEKKLANIYNNLDLFFQKIIDLKVMSFDSMKKENYKPMLDIIDIDKENILIKAIAIYNIQFKEDKEERELEMDKLYGMLPKNQYVLFLKAYLEEKSGQYKKAKHFYEEVLKINPEYAEAHNNYAMLLKDRFNDMEGAKAHFERALEINPQLADAHNYYAKLLQYKFNDMESAKAHYEKALEIDPQYAEAHTAYAFLLGSKFNDKEGAKAHYERALEINPQYAHAHFGLFLVLFDKFNDMKAAKEHYIRAIELNASLIESEVDKRFNIKR
jgi:tetratricopeptide (TPR) repeat protein